MSRRTDPSSGAIYLQEGDDRGVVTIRPLGSWKTRRIPSIDWEAWPEHQWADDGPREPNPQTNRESR